jgi:spermidine/putrescine transport system ATP-binding protein
MQIKALRSPECVRGSEVVVAIRPEKIWLSPQRHSHLENQFAGSIEELVYSGTDTRYLVRLGHQVLLIVRQQNLDASALRRGDRVYVGWPAQGAQVLQPDPEN